MWTDITIPITNTVIQIPIECTGFTTIIPIAAQLSNLFKDDYNNRVGCNIHLFAHEH